MEDVKLPPIPFDWFVTLGDKMHGHRVSHHDAIQYAREAVLLERKRHDHLGALMFGKIRLEDWHRAMRSVFEEYCYREGLEDSKQPDGNYADENTSLEWMAWQDAWNAGAECLWQMLSPVPRDNGPSEADRRAFEASLFTPRRKK